MPPLVPANGPETKRGMMTRRCRWRPQHDINAISTQCPRGIGSAFTFIAAGEERILPSREIDRITLWALPSVVLSTNE